MKGTFEFFLSKPSRLVVASGIILVIFLLRQKKIV